MILQLQTEILSTEISDFLKQFFSSVKCLESHTGSFVYRQLGIRACITESSLCISEISDYKEKSHKTMMNKVEDSVQFESVGWFGLNDPFETIFQSISGRRPENGTTKTNDR